MESKPGGRHLYVVFFFEPKTCSATLLCLDEDWRTLCLQQSVAPAALLPTLPKTADNKPEDDDDKSFWGMARPTHLLVHHTVCTVILNKDQRETTGDWLKEATHMWKSIFVHVCVGTNVSITVLSVKLLTTAMQDSASLSLSLFLSVRTK